MSMKDLEEAMALWEQNIDKGYISGGKSEDTIRHAEHVLGLMFSPTYRIFLKEHGCGYLNSLEIDGIINDKFEKSECPDGVGLTLQRRELEGFPLHFIIISDTGDGCWYCLDTSQVNSDGEYPVVIWRFGIPEENKEKVAEDFGEFLLEQTKQALED